MQRDDEYFLRKLLLDEWNRPYRDTGSKTERLNHAKLSLQVTDQHLNQQGGYMNKLIENFATATAMLGIAVTIGAGLARLLGMYHLGGFQTMTVFNGGMGLMLIGIVGKLHVLKR